MKIKQIFVSGIRHTIALSIASTTAVGIAIPSSEVQTAILATNNPTSQINLRLAPTTQSEAVDFGNPGDRILIRNQTKGTDGYIWYYVKLQESGVTGWVRGDLITTQNRDKNIQTRRDVTSIPSEIYRLGNSEAANDLSRREEITPVTLQQEGISHTNNQKSQKADLAKRKYTPEEISYFMEIALGAEFSENDFSENSNIIRKWQGDLRIKVIGSPTSEDLKTLRTVINQINNLASGIELKIVDDRPNVKIHFVPVSEFSRYEPNYQPGNYGYAWTNCNENNIIYSANILITTTGVNQKERSHLIREELTQSLGLLKDSYKYENSIFYQPWTDTYEYSQLDKTVIQILYRPEIRPGMTKSQVMNFLKRN